MNASVRCVLRRCCSYAAILNVAAAILGCDNPAEPAQVTGEIDVSVSTTTAKIDLDPTGYTLSIDGQLYRYVAETFSGRIPYLKAGNHLVQLGDVAPNCSVDGVNPRTVEVIAGASASVISFSVSCVANVGSIRVLTTTSGPDQDPDGYLMGIDGITRSVANTNGSQLFDLVRVGSRNVSLNGVSRNCIVEGSNPRPVSIGFGAIGEAAFVVNCVAGGSLRVTSTTTGVAPTANGYELDIRFQGPGSSISLRVPTAGSADLSPLIPGTYAITITDMPWNCDLSQPEPLVVAVNAGSPTPLAFDVRCVEPTQIAFVSESFGSMEIEVVNSLGADRKRLTFNSAADVNPEWSPDGSRIAFASNRDGNFAIYVMNADGSSQTRLSSAAAYDHSPSWSPDGRTIAFVSERNGNADIYVMNADGTNQTRLTSYTGYDADPAWSPDGTRIAFVSNRDATPGVWLMNPDGSGLRRLNSESMQVSQPAWSPDGARIAFSRSSGNYRDIYLMNADGSGLRWFTESTAEAQHPAWSPDGRKIVFAECNYGWYDYDCQSFMSIARIDGGSRPVPFLEGSDPAWRR